MPKKNSSTVKKKPKVDAENEWAHITTGDGYRSKISDADAIGVQARNVFFRDDDDILLTKEIPTTDVVREGLKDASKETRDADQYMKYVNAFLTKRLSEIKEIQDKKKRFDAEIEALKPTHLRNFERLAKLPLNKLDSREASMLLNGLSQERENIVMRLEHYKGKVISTMNILELHDKKINEVFQYLQKKIIEQKNVQTKKPEDTIHAELQNLEDVYGMESLSNALEKLKNLKERKNG